MLLDQFMPRKQLNLKIDDRLIPALKKAANLAGGMSINGYMEQLLMGHLKNLGQLPMDIEPLQETRGGVREKAGRPKKSISGDSTADNQTDGSNGDPESLK
jgi:hypothetical protein